MNQQPRYGDLMATIAQLERRVSELESRIAADQVAREMYARKKFLAGFKTSDLIDTKRKRMGEIALAVAMANGISVKEIIGQSREWKFSHPRQTAFLLCHRQGYSYPEIGRFFGGRDHTTVIHGCRRAAEREAEGEI